MTGKREIISLINISTSKEQAALFGEKNVLQQLNWQMKQDDQVCMQIQKDNGMRQFMALLQGKLLPQSGSIEVNQTRIDDLPTGMQSKLLQNHIGFINAGEQLDPFLTVLENVYMPVWGVTKAVDQYRIQIQAYLHHIGLDGMMDRFPHQITPLQNVQVYQLRAFIRQPALVVVDWSNAVIYQTFEWLSTLANLTQTGLLLLIPACMTPPQEGMACHVMRNGKICPEEG